MVLGTESMVNVVESSRVGETGKKEINGLPCISYIPPMMKFMKTTREAEK